MNIRIQLSNTSQFRAFQYSLERRESKEAAMMTTPLFDILSL
jgi:hypothetical protein